MFEDTVISLRRLVVDVPSMVAALGAILDAGERKGRLPGRITVAADERTARALARVLSTRAVSTVAPGRVKLDLRLADRRCREQLDSGLSAVLYAVLDRTPRDPIAERAHIDAALDRGLAALRGRTEASRAFLVAELTDASESHRMAREVGTERAIDEASKLVRAIDAALTMSEPTRVANFAARVLGDSKALGAGSDRARRLGRALLDHHEPTAHAVYLDSYAVSEPQALRFALEVNGVCRDEATVTAYCFGPLVYRKTGHTFDHVLRHAQLGEPVALSLAQLRDAAAVDLAVDRVLVIENQTPFLDYIDHIRGAGLRELVVLSRGQANWAVVQLLRLASRAGVPIAHTGDLDRSGVLILRSLESRLFCPVTPIAMDVATHRRFRDRGRPLTDPESQRVQTACERDLRDDSCTGLLREIHRTGIWIEQEHIFGDIVIRATRHEPQL